MHVSFYHGYGCHFDYYFEPGVEGVLEKQRHIAQPPRRHSPPSCKGRDEKHQ